MNREGGGAGPRSPLIAHRSSLAILAAVALILFLRPLATGEVFTLRDHFDYFQPLRWFTAEELRAGRLPLWNPYSASGEPWLANPQTGVFYPPAWLFVVLPFPTAYMLFLLLHLVVLGWGAYLLFRRSVSAGAALVGATALMVSGPVLSLLDVSNNLATLAWIPLALWCAREGAWMRGGVVLALAFLGGEPFFAAAGALLYAVAGARRASRHSLSTVVYAALIAVGLTAIQLFPFLELVRGSDRAAGLDESLVLLHSMTVREWLRIAVPPKLDAGAVDPALTQQFIPMVYVGMSVCALALIGIRRRTLPWLVLLLAAFLLSLGPAFLARLPLTLFRYPARLVPFAALAVAALAAAGWERVRKERRWVDLLVVAVIVVDLVPRAWPLLQSAPFRRDAVPYPAMVGLETKLLRADAVDPRRRAAWISGYLNLYDRRFDSSTAAPVVSDRYLRMYRALLARPTPEDLGRKGIGWILTTRPLGAPRVAVSEGVGVYRNRNTFPMAFVIVREPLLAIPARVLLDTSGARMTIDAPREGVAVVLQQNAPGWRVWLDGLEARAVTIDGVFRGVQVTRGRHLIVWRYRPASLVAGAVVTSLTLLAMTLFVFVKRAR